MIRHLQRAIELLELSEQPEGETVVSRADALALGKALLLETPTLTQPGDGTPQPGLMGLL